MKTVNARQANQQFSALLSRMERGEEVVITKRGLPVAVLTPYLRAKKDGARRQAIAQAVKLMTRGLPAGFLQQFRDTAHQR